jgi:hypothetical protein
VALELPGKEVELRRAAFHEEDLDGPVDGGGPDAGHAQNADRQVVGGHPEGGRSDDRFLHEALAEMRRGAGRRRRGHEHAPPPASLNVAAPLEILDDARDGIGIDAEEAGELADAGQGLIPGNAAALDDVLELLRQLPADRDRALRVHRQVHRDPHTVWVR